MTITTYTKESSFAADRDNLEIFWGDGLSQWIKRANGKGQSLENDVKLNIYTAEHTYPGRSTYTISFVDPNRSGNIVNINYPRSDEIPFIWPHVLLYSTYSFRATTTVQCCSSLPSMWHV